MNVRNYCSVSLDEVHIIGIVRLFMEIQKLDRGGGKVTR